MKIEEQQLKAFLLDSELVKKADIEKAEAEAKKSGKKIDDVLLALGKINEEELKGLYFGNSLRQFGRGKN